MSLRIILIKRLVMWREHRNKIMKNEKQPTATSRTEPVIDWIRQSELLLGYTEFNKTVEGRELDDDNKKWLGEWSSWDLACSPMNDKERSLIRYGHYLGFFRGIAT